MTAPSETRLAVAFVVTQFHIHDPVVRNLKMRMTRDGARLAIVAFSISISGVLLVFFLLGPAFGMPFTPGASENLHLTQIVLPVFLGYLGSAVQFIFRSRHREAEMPAEDQRLLFLLVNGPFVLFVIFNLSLFSSFYMRNQLGGSGLTFEELSQWFSIGLGLLTATISAISGYVFGASAERVVNTTVTAPNVAGGSS